MRSCQSWTGFGRKKVMQFYCMADQNHSQRKSKSTLYKIYCFISLSLTSFYCGAMLLRSTSSVIDQVTHGICKPIWWYLIGLTCLSGLATIGIALRLCYKCFCSVIDNETKSSYSLYQMIFLGLLIAANAAGFIIPFSNDNFDHCRSQFETGYFRLYLAYIFYLVAFTINVTWFGILAISKLQLCCCCKRSSSEKELLPRTRQSQT